MQHVFSGMYKTESDLVCDALDRYFQRASEGEVMDEIVVPRLESLLNGTLETTPWDSAEMRRWREEEIEKVNR